MFIQKRKTISTRQLAILAFIISLGAKLFSLPVLLLKSGGRDAWLPLVVFIAADILILGILIAASRLRPDRTAFETVEAAAGKILARIVFAAVFLGLAIRALMLMLNITTFVGADLFDGVPQWILLFPIALLMTAFGAKSLRTIGRTGEVLIFLIVPALVVLMFFMIKTADPVRMLPLFGSEEPGTLGRTFLNFAFFFGDIAALFIAIGKIDPLAKTKASEQSAMSDSKVGTNGSERPLSVDNADTQYTPLQNTASPADLNIKNPELKAISNTNRQTGFHPLAIISALVAAAFVITYCVMLFSTYMDVRHYLNPNSVAFVTHTAVSRFAFGRFDKILFVVLATALLITLAVVSHAAVRTAKFIAPKIKVTWLAFGFALILYIIAVFVNTNAFFDFLMRFGVYAAAACTGFFVLILLVCAIAKRDKKKVKAEDTGT